jgi:hypothetical protein
MMSFLERQTNRPYLAKPNTVLITSFILSKAPLLSFSNFFSLKEHVGIKDHIFNYAKLLQIFAQKTSVHIQSRFISIISFVYI